MKRNPNSPDEVTARIQAGRDAARPRVQDRIEEIDQCVNALRDGLWLPHHHAGHAFACDLMAWARHLTSERGSLFSFEYCNAPGTAFQHALGFLGEVDKRMLPALSRAAVLSTRRDAWSKMYGRLCDGWEDMLKAAPLGDSAQPEARDAWVREHAPAIVKGFRKLACAVAGADPLGRPWRVHAGDVELDAKLNDILRPTVHTDYSISAAVTSVDYIDCD